MQWKSSNLTITAYAYRRLTSGHLQKVNLHLDAHNVFYSVHHDKYEKCRIQRMSCYPGEVGPDGLHKERRPRDAEFRDTSTEWDEWHRDLILLGLCGSKLSPSFEMTQYVQAIQECGIRFMVFSPEADKKTRMLGSLLGLDAGWNCLISLEHIPESKQFRNLDGRVVLPSGIDEIQTWVKDIDQVPLTVPLFSRSSPGTVRAMIRMLQDHSRECVVVVGSALQPNNFSTFREAECSVSVLVGTVPACRQCGGQCVTFTSAYSHDHKKHRKSSGGAGDVEEENVSWGVPTPQLQLSADLTSLPCALQARFSYEAGEQRTLGVLYNAIKEARRCVDCIYLSLLFHLGFVLMLSMTLFLQGALNIPPLQDGLQIAIIIFVLAPAVSTSLLNNKAGDKIMTEFPLKRSHEKTYDQPSRMLALYAVRFTPTAIFATIAFMAYLTEACKAKMELVGDFITASQLTNEALATAANATSAYDSAVSFEKHCSTSIFSPILFATGFKWEPCAAAMDLVFMDVSVLPNECETGYDSPCNPFPHPIKQDVSAFSLAHVRDHFYLFNYNIIANKFRRILRSLFDFQSNICQSF